jgi:pyrroloquinoline quinone biosynthesis protein D
MSEKDPSMIDGTVRISLAPGVRAQKDRITGQTMLLYPEGTLQLNSTGAAITELCDGRTFDEIVSALATRFGAPADVLRADIGQYLHRLRERRLVQWTGTIDDESVKR